MSDRTGVNGGSILATNDLISRASSRRPLLIAMTWWTVCFSIYLFEIPIAYSHHNLLWVSTVFIATFACTMLGYRIGVGNAGISIIGRSWQLPLPVTIGFVASVALVIPMNQAYAGISVLDVGTAIANQSGAYNLAAAKVADGFDARSGIVIAQTVLAPFTLASTPFLALSWFEARKHGILLLISVLAPTALGLVTGRSQQIATLVIVLAGTWILSLVRRRRGLRKPQIIALSIVGMGLTLAFGAQKLARMSGYSLCVPGEGTCRPSDIGLIEGTWIEISSYASQGFEGLGHALDAEWNFGGGLSHSSPLQAMVGPLLQFQPPVVVTSQLDGLDWSSTGYWSTGLASIANDVPWIFVPLAVGLQAAVMGLSWRVAVRDADWLSTAVFAYSWLALLFMPQNLQIAISGPSYIGYITLVGFFIFRRIGRRVGLSSRSSLGEATEGAL